MLAVQRSLVHGFAVLALVIISSVSFAGEDYPKGPDARLTPGALCTTPNSYRYPEKIPYCERDVASSEKKQIFRNYDEQLGYHTQAMNRQEFKIDHYIPLCMGGANSSDNLWPQHNDVYAITDPMEPLACARMAQGVLTQAKAIELIKRGKNDLSQVDAVMAELEGM